MKKACTTVILLSLVLVAQMACTTSAPTANTLQWKKIGQGNGWNSDGWHGNIEDIVYVGREPRLLIIDDPLAVPSLELRVLPRDLQRVAKTDFSRFWVAVIYQGQRYTDRHIYSTKVREVTLQDDTIYIQAEFQERYYTGQWSLDNSTPSPYYVLRIQKPAEMASEPAFVLNTGTQIVPQLCAISGEYVPWEPIASDPNDYSPGVGPSPRLLIIQTPDRAPSNHPSSYYSPETGIDLRTHFGVVAYQGEQATTEHGIDVISVKRQKDAILVCAQFIEPVGGAGQAMTTPYYVFQVERTEDLRGNITPFLLLDNGTEVAREVAVIR